MYYVGLDLETTGLDRKRGSILELAMTVCNERLEEVSTYRCTVSPLPGYENDFTKLDPVVIEMHTKNGLFDEIRRGECLRRYQAEESALAFLKPYSGKLMMVGNSVYWDRLWLADDHMPKLDAVFMRHLIDVTSLNRFAELTDKELFRGRPKHPETHRALDDARASLNTLRYYANFVETMERVA